MDRLRILGDAGIALGSELSFDALRQRIVETAALLTGRMARLPGRPRSRSHRKALTARTAGTSSATAT